MKPEGKRTGKGSTVSLPAKGSSATCRYWQYNRNTEEVKVYHASGTPTLRTGSVVKVPPKCRVTAPYGERISNTPYAREDGNGWSPRLLADVERSYTAKREARRTRTTRTNPKIDRAAAERKLVATVRMGEVD